MGQGYRGRNKMNSINDVPKIDDIDMNNYYTRL